MSGNIDIAAAALAGVLLPPGFVERLLRLIEVVIIPQGALQLVPFALVPVDLRLAPSWASL